MDNYTLYNKIALHSWIFIFHHSSALSSKRQDGMTALEGRFCKHIVGIKQSCAIVLDGTTILCQHRQILVRAQKKELYEIFVQYASSILHLLIVRTSVPAMHLCTLYNLHVLMCKDKNT